MQYGQVEDGTGRNESCILCFKRIIPQTTYGVMQCYCPSAGIDKFLTGSLMGGLYASRS